jgi:hypothetical protein
MRHDEDTSPVSLFRRASRLHDDPLALSRRDVELVVDLGQRGLATGRRHVAEEDGPWRRRGGRPASPSLARESLASIAVRLANNGLPAP